MKRIILILWSAVGIVLLIVFFVSNPIPSNEVNLSLNEVPLSNLMGDSVLFNNENYPYKLIVNFYGTECGLCLTEINDIVSFSRMNNINVVFITADSLSAIERFINELKRQKITDEKISFGRITLGNAQKLFGDLTVPQTILVNENFEVIARKKGVISYSFLKRYFE